MIPGMDEYIPCWPPFGWANLMFSADGDDTDVQIHVMPEGDIKAHTGPGCWCEPENDGEDPEVWIHNSADEREYFEADRRFCH